MCDELYEQDIESLPLPKDWAANVRNAVLNVFGFGRIAMLAGREFLIREGIVLQARIGRLETEVSVPCDGLLTSKSDAVTFTADFAGPVYREAIDLRPSACKRLSPSICFLCGTDYSIFAAGSGNTWPSTMRKPQ